MGVKSPVVESVVWRMYRTDPEVHDPRVSWSAVGDVACARMGSMLLSLMDTRAAYWAKTDAASWSESFLPSVMVYVDEGIDLGPVFDKVAKSGPAVGVFMRVISEGIDGSE